MGTFYNVISSFPSFKYNSAQILISCLSCGLPNWFIFLILLCGDVHKNPGPQNKNLITGFLLNIRSLKSINSKRNKLAQFQSTVALKNPKIICLNETWLNPSINNQEILPDSEYNIYRNDRVHARGGGVLTAIHTSIKSKRREDLNSNNPLHNEILVVEVKFPKLKKIALINMYRPPNDLDLACVSNLYTCLNKIRTAGFTNICLMGDLNLPNINTVSGLPTNNNNNSELFYNIFQEFGLTHKIHAPTHNSGNTLDFILTTFPDKFKKINTEISPIESDHLMINFTINIEHKLPNLPPRQVFNYKKAKWSDLKSDITNSNLEHFILECDDVNQACTYWTNTVTNLLNKHIPKIKIKNSNTPPWIDSEVINISKRKETARRRANKLNTDQSWTKYNKIRNKLKSLTKSKYLNYINDISTSLFNNSKRFWGVIKNKTKSRFIPETMFYNNQQGSTPLDKANLLNNFFFSNFTPRESGSTLPVINEFQNPELSNIHLTVAEVRIALESIDISKATGPDELSGKILKECAPQLAPSLTSLFNKSLQHGIVPDLWKTANVAPIHKKNEKNMTENYRPISLLCLPSKILERCIYNNIFHKVNHLITRLQHGFLRGRSTSTQLLIVLNQIISNLDNNFQTDIIYLDFSKAFDSVSHKLLILKLKSLGFCGSLLHWFDDYLTGRLQRVVLEGSCSDWLPVNSGVPQGSILGPLLFLFYINDMADAVSPASTLALFADDSKVFRQIRSVHDSVLLQADLDSLLTWSRTWKLNFNINKCKILSINNTNPLLLHNYTISNSPLVRVDHINDLGLIINGNLNWETHINSKIAKADKMLGLVKRTVGYRCPQKTKQTLYNTLVKSSLSYGSIIWSYGSKKMLKRIESVQRRATKYITSDYNSDYKTRLLKCNLLPLSYSKEVNDICFLYKCIHQIYNIDIRQILSFYDAAHSRTRLGQRPFSLKPPPKKTKKAKDFFTRSIVKTWNSLPAEVVNIIPTNSKIIPFKNRVKKLYLVKLENTFNPYDLCTWRTFCPCGRC